MQVVENQNYTSEVQLLFKDSLSVLGQLSILPRTADQGVVCIQKARGAEAQRLPMSVAS
jgi:hypothetical protein